MAKIKCNNTLCDYCVRWNTNIKDSYRCVLEEVKLEISLTGNLNDDVVWCLSYEARDSQKGKDK